MKGKTVLTAVFTAVIVLAAAGVGGMMWHNSEIRKMQERNDSLANSLLEEEERRREVEAALEDMKAKSRDLADRIEIVQNNKNSWIAKCSKLTDELQKAKEKYIQSDVVLDSAEIQHEVRKINELAVVEYKYRQTAMIDSQNTFQFFILDGTRIPFTGKNCIISMDGTIKVGINADKAEVRDDSKSKKLVVSLPEPEVLSNELDENSLFVYNEEDTIFNRLNADDHSKLRQEIKDDATGLAEANGVLQQADERVKQLIKTMLEQIPGFSEQYTVEFRTVK